MLKSIKHIAFFTAAAFLLIFPCKSSAQDLGSSSGLFRALNPATKKSSSSAEKKSTVKKTAVKTTPVKTASRNNVSKNTSPPKKEIVAKGKTALREKIAPMPQENIVITVGKPVKNNVNEAYERAIEEGNAWRDARNYVAAESAYHRAQGLNSKDARAIYGLGNLFTDQQRWEEAEKAYRQAIQLEPNSPEARIALSFILTQPVAGANLGNRFVEAEVMARKAIQLDADNAIAYDQLGAALELRGQIGSETTGAYRRAIQLDPNFAPAYAHLGRLLRRVGNVKESDAAYRDSIRLATDVPTMILVADVMQSQQRFSESEQLLRRALRFDQKNPTALFLLGRALTTRGSYDEAERLLKRSVEVSPNSFVSYALLSSVYTRRGNFNEAERVLMKALRVVSANERKRLAQEFQAVGDGLRKAGKNKDAERVYRQAATLDGEKNGASR